MYLTDTALSSFRGRLDDKAYAKAAKITSKFKVKHKRDASHASLCGNIQVLYSGEGVARLSGLRSVPKNPIYASEQISSALALYRSISLFKCGLDAASNQDFYKTNWSLSLEHKKTGLIFMLGEWKGGFQIFTPAHDIEELPEDYIKDAEALLTLLASNECPIGYDGVLAGTVA